MNYRIYHNENGPDIGCGDSKGVIEQDGLFFKDLEGTGELLPYEDWRLPAEERAQDLAIRLTVEEIAGLMLYSPHQRIPSPSGGPFPGFYDGKAFEESGAEPYALSDEQKKYLKDQHIRYVLVMDYAGTEVMAKWNNEMQALAESLPHGIPVNFSTDPRNGVNEERAAEFKGSTADLSQWPEGLGMAALFSEEAIKSYASIISREYRALGMTTALSPQADLATEPRWMRMEDTFGTSPEQVKAAVQAYCSGLQETEGSENGWGNLSVAAMVKHWPGAGPMESGRDAHYYYGKFAVYPGDNLKDHMYPFLEGAFKLGKTGKAASVMPYYSVPWNQDTKDHRNVGSSYSTYLIHDLLREKYGYDGVICTDWGITGKALPDIGAFGPKCHGVEDLDEAAQHLLLIENGIDQFGGNSDIAPILEAYRMGCEKHGENEMRARMVRSAKRLLTNSFRCGLFENPYLDPEESCRITGCKEYMEAGYRAQLGSVVMLKNNSVLPLCKTDNIKDGSSLPLRGSNIKVYIPIRHITPGITFFRTPGGEPYDLDPMYGKDLPDGFIRVNTPEEADVSVVFLDSPKSECYDISKDKDGGSGYFPISLQYRPYRAGKARVCSIAGGDFRERSDNRTYLGKEAIIYNESDLDNVVETKQRMGSKPVIAVIRMHNPAVLSELEPYADAILCEFGVEKRAVFDLLTGKAEPSGLLPIQLPSDMDTVEQHKEDVPFDLTPYTDSCGNTYDYGFGLDWSGPIKDGRADKYR
ncbi:MAG: glycoside hydrolase family 3 C-terminal domain-containing protein [Blautia sp.]|nr:glycoside hydrolase family 3 C-terminal domain-containing protein [Blautia sp.]